MIEECNFKQTHTTDGDIYNLSIRMADLSRLQMTKQCPGEENCFLFQIYNELVMKRRLVPIGDMIPTYPFASLSSICSKCGVDRDDTGGKCECNKNY